MEFAPGRPTATGGHTPTRANDGDSRYGKTCALFLRSTRSGRWRWADNCCSPSPHRRPPEQRTQSLCTRSSVLSAAPSCDVWGTPQDPKPPQAETGNTPPRTREATPSGPPRPSQHGTRMACPLQLVTGSWRAPHRRLIAPPKSRRPAGGPSENRRGTATDMRQHTAAGRPPADGETTRHPWDRLPP